MLRSVAFVLLIAGPFTAIEAQAQDAQNAQAAACSKAIVDEAQKLHNKLRTGHLSLAIRDAAWAHVTGPITDWKQDAKKLQSPLDLTAQVDAVIKLITPPEEKDAKVKPVEPAKPTAAALALLAQIRAGLSDKHAVLLGALPAADISDTINALASTEAAKTSAIESGGAKKLTDDHAEAAKNACSAVIAASLAKLKDTDAAPVAACDSALTTQFSSLAESARAEYRKLGDTIADLTYLLAQIEAEALKSVEDVTAANNALELDTIPAAVTTLSPLEIAKIGNRTSAEELEAAKEDAKILKIAAFAKRKLAELKARGEQARVVSNDSTLLDREILKTRCVDVVAEKAKQLEERGENEPKDPDVVRLEAAQKRLAAAKKRLEGDYDRRVCAAKHEKLEEYYELKRAQLRSKERFGIHSARFGRISRNGIVRRGQACDATQWVIGKCLATDAKTKAGAGFCVFEVTTLNHDTVCGFDPRNAGNTKPNYLFVNYTCDGEYRRVYIRSGGKQVRMKCELPETDQAIEAKIAALKTAIGTADDGCKLALK